MSQEQPSLADVEAAVLENARAFLGISRISLEDNFVDLGGRSILASRLLNRLEPLLGYRPPLRYVFEADDFHRVPELLIDKSLQVHVND